MHEHQQTHQSKNLESSSQRRRTILTNQSHASNPASIIQRARINPKSLTSADVLQLQRTIGNRAVGKLLSEIRNQSKVQQAPIQRQKLEHEEICPSCVQKQEIPEEEETLQGKFETIQQQAIPEEEEKLQMKPIVQRQEIPEEEETLQGKMIEPVQRQEIPEEEEPLQPKRENNTGMPDNLKAGVESLSGIDMSDVRVHYNSDKPAKVGALAYTQGTNIHVAPGQEKHLSHEAWHVVQQMEGRVQPTMQLKEGIPVNDDKGLEHEADEMAIKALEHTGRIHNAVTDNIQINSVQVQQFKNNQNMTNLQESTCNVPVVQREERQTTLYTEERGHIWKKNMQIIDSDSVSDYVHLSRSTDTDTDNDPINIHELPEDVEYFGLQGKRQKVETGTTFDRENYTEENNVHITLEGRYMQVMRTLETDMFDNRDAIKNGPPVGDFANLNFGDSEAKGKEPVSNYAIQQWIEIAAEDTEDFLRTNVAEEYQDRVPELIDVVNDVKDSTLNFTNNLITSTPALDELEKNNKLVHYGGAPWART